MGESTGFQIIGYWLIGGRHIVNKVRPVNKPADCAGLKIRVINSQVYIQTFRALGATAVAMDPSELYLALQQGVVDGFEYPLPDLIAYKFYEVSKYLSLDGHTTDFFLISINRALWQGMSKEEQDMMAQAMKTAMDWQWREQPGEIEKSLAKLKTLMQVNELSPADKALFVEATRPVYAQFEAFGGEGLSGLCAAAAWIGCLSDGRARRPGRDRGGGTGAVSRHDCAGFRGAGRDPGGRCGVYPFHRGRGEQAGLSRWRPGWAVRVRPIDSDDVTVRSVATSRSRRGRCGCPSLRAERPKTPIALLFTLVWKREQQGWRLWQRQATRVVEA